MLIMHPIEEVHNCNNPNTLGDMPHLICVWTDSDFIDTNDGGRVLRPNRKKDNLVKAHYRRKYWEKESNIEKAW